MRRAAMLTFAPASLETFVHRVFLALGADDDVACEVARHLIRANLSGHDSHGAMRVAQYVRQADAGELVPSARPSVLKKTGSAVLVDAKRGMGHFSTRFALDRAMEHAGKNGVAAAAIRRSMHIGRVGEYPEWAAERGFVALVTAGAAGHSVGGMAPWGGTERFITPSPLAIGVPMEGRTPFLFDAAMTTVAQGKVKVARDKGVDLPPDCITDREGNPTTDPEDYFAGGAILPLGGRVAGHKGYAMALAAVLLGGLGMIDDDDPALIGAPVHDPNAEPRGRMSGVFVFVVDPAAFGGAEGYRQRVAATVEEMKAAPKADGVEEILIPGELEVRTRQRRRRDGIALPEITCRELHEIGDRFGVEYPPPVEAEARAGALPS